jgi:hypothetical protein
MGRQRDSHAVPFHDLEGIMIQCINCNKPCGEYLYCHKCEPPAVLQPLTGEIKLVTQSIEDQEKEHLADMRNTCEERVDVRGVHPILFIGMIGVALEGKHRSISIEDAMHVAANV